jgi:hypothetical protein
VSNFWKIFISVVITVVIVGGGVFWIMQNQINNIRSNNQSQMDTLNKQIATLKSAVTTASWENYTNSEYGFSLTFDSLWQNYKVFDWLSNQGDVLPAKDVVDICLPSSANKVAMPLSAEAGFACPIKINVYDSSTYQSLSAQSASDQGMNAAAGQILGTRNGLTFVLGAEWASQPTDLSAITDQEINNVVSSFKLTN